MSGVLCTEGHVMTINYSFAVVYATVRDDVKLYHLLSSVMTLNHRTVRLVHNAILVVGRTFARCLIFVHSPTPSVRDNVKLSTTLASVRNDGNLHFSESATALSTPAWTDHSCLLIVRDEIKLEFLFVRRSPSASVASRFRFALSPR